MLNLFYHLVFLIFTIYVLIQSISYALYEIRQEKNLLGGKFVIIFSTISVIFSNIVVWQN